MALKSVEEADLKGKRVLARFDFNVPLSKTKNKEITDTYRIDLALPTIKYLLNQGVTKLVLMSHLGRPKGTVNPDLSLEPVASYLAEKLEKEVILSDSAVDCGMKNFLNLPDTKIVLLENLRFNPEEKENNYDFAKKLSEYGDIYVNDAFGVNHRKHASIHQINSFFKGRAYAGFLLIKEIESISTLLNKPKKPFVGVIGGAKVSDKIKTIEKLLVTVDTLIIGGAMAYPFLKSKGIGVGKSLCSQEDILLATNILKKDKGKKIHLPTDHIVSDRLNGQPKKLTTQMIPDDKIGLDIGPQTLNNYAEIIATANTIFWNGPMGLFENKDFSEGTMRMAHFIADSDAFSVVGGGDSVSAVKLSGTTEKFSHVSTGGGASLEMIEKGQLPGIQALKFGL